MPDDDAQSYCPIPHRDETPRKSARGTVLCGGHVDGLRRALSELAMFEQDADQAAYDLKLSRHDGAPITGNAERPLPVDLRKIPEPGTVKIADAQELLIGYCLYVARGRHLSPPRRRRLIKLRPCEPQAACGLRKCQTVCQNLRMRPGPILEPLCEFLLLHLDWIVAQEYAEQFATEMLDLAGKAASIIRPSGNRQFVVGECIEPVEGQRCGGVMWARITPSDEQFLADADIICDRCGHRVDSGDWLVYGHQLRKHEANDTHESSAA